MFTAQGRVVMVFEAKRVHMMAAFCGNFIPEDVVACQLFSAEVGANVDPRSSGHAPATVRGQEAALPNWIVSRSN